jgi:hypothetical protein
MLGRVQAPPPLNPPPPPSPPTDVPEDPDDLYFEDDDDELEAAEVEQRAAEKATEQWALVWSFESAKEAAADAHDHAQAEEEELRGALELSVRRAPTEVAGDRLFAEERQRLLEDAAERRPFFAVIRRMQRVAASATAEQRKREGDDARAVPSITPKDASRLG